MPLVFEPKSAIAALNLSALVPCALEGSSAAQIAAMKLNGEFSVGEFFRVSGDLNDGTIQFKGDCSRCDFIGSKMSSGTIIVGGDVGHYLGSQMTGGTIHVHGSAGSHVGAAPYGSRFGMNGGTIVIQGNSAARLGYRMRRGLIVVNGNVGPLAASDMLAGTIVVQGECSAPIGAGMRRGTLLLGGASAELLPTFKRAYRGQPLAARMLMQRLKALASIQAPAQVEVYNGDALEGCRGEVWLRV